MNSSGIGVIPAGGKSSRMGRDKALLKLGARPFVWHVARMLQEVFNRVILVANDLSAYGFLGLETIGDIYQDCGPLGGIHSALIRAGNADVFIYDCDTPFVTRELVRYIVGFDSDAPAKIPSFKQQLHPLCGLDTQNCLPEILKRLESRRLRVDDGR